MGGSNLQERADFLRTNFRCESEEKTSLSIG